MRQPSIAHFAALSFSLFIAASLGFAQSPPGYLTDSERARASFEQGIVALQGGRMHDASIALELSYRLSPFAVVLYNLGLARRGEGRTIDAVDAFERYLAAPEPDVAPELLATVGHEVTRLRGQLASIHLRVTTARALVTLDGLVPTRPLGDLLVNPGLHMLEISASGYRTRRMNITLGAGESETHEVALEVPQRLTVTPNVTEAAVLVDGQLQGLGVTVVSLEAGAHTVEVRAAGFVPQRQGVFAAATGAARLSVILTPMVALRSTSRRWFAPLVFGGAALVVVSGIVIAAVLLSPESVPEYNGNWATVRQ